MTIRNSRRSYIRRRRVPLAEGYWAIFRVISVRLSCNISDATSADDVAYSAYPSTMDDLLLFQTLVSRHWLEAETDQEIVDKLRLVAAVLVVGSNEDHTWAVEN